MEWMCAFLLFFFFLSYIVDLWPRNYYGKQQAMAEKRASKNGGVDPETGTVPPHQTEGTDSNNYSVDPYINAPQQDQYGTVSTAPSISQPPLREAYHQQNGNRVA